MHRHHDTDNAFTYSVFILSSLLYIQEVETRLGFASKATPVDKASQEALMTFLVCGDAVGSLLLDVIPILAIEVCVCVCMN